MKWFFVLLFIIVTSGSLFATNYYFSSINGNDGNNGTTSSSPWYSVSKINSLNLKSGDNLFFERGSVWYEVQLYINSKVGTSTAPIKFQTYGTGNNPILSGGKRLTGFTKSGNTYNISVTRSFPRGHIVVPTGILINGKWKDIARSPEYFVLGSQSNVYLSDPSKSWVTNEFAGSLIIMQPVHWSWCPSLITSNTSNTISFQKVSYYSSADKYMAYYIANHDKFLIDEGDWTFKNNQLKVQYFGDLNSQNVQFAMADTVIALNNCSFMTFDNLVLEMANFRHFSAWGGKNITVNNCEFRYSAGAAVKFDRTDNIYFEKNYIHDCGAEGMRLDLFGYTQVRYNLFKRIATQNIGMANYDFRYGAALSIHNATSTNSYFEYNVFDSVGIAIQSHTFRPGQTASLSYNYIENYGVTISDCGAFYFNSDYDPTSKYIKNNIIKDAVTAGVRYYPYGDNAKDPHPTLHPHGIYIDEGGKGYICDSNTIENSNIAYYLNRNYSNAFYHGNIVSADQYLKGSQYNTIYMKDQAVGPMDFSADRDIVKYNNIVLGDDPGARVYLRHINQNALNSGADYNNFYFDNNKVANPYQSATYTGKYMYEWGTKTNSYTIDQMRSDGGNVSSLQCDLSTIINPQGIQYSQVSGLVSKNDFVKLFTNFSKKSRLVNLGNATYRDIDGRVITGTTTIPPFYSKILFYVSGSVGTSDPESYIDSTLVPALIWGKPKVVNSPPTIQSKTFTVQQTNPVVLKIGKVSASDPDAGQVLSYSIYSGNVNNLFSINSAGEIYFTTSTVDFTNSPKYTLGVRVIDNSAVPLSATANIYINLVEVKVNKYPIIINQHFTYRAEAGAWNVVADVVASDPDLNTISYAIVAGNTEMFSIDATTGRLTINTSLINQMESLDYPLSIRVTDNGTPALSVTATITVTVVPLSKLIYIDPNASTGGTGSLELPVNTLEEINIKSGYTYLLKRNSTLTIDHIDFEVSDIIISAYGEGENPVINSTSSDYVMKAVDKTKIKIENITINAENATSGIYFIGPTSTELCVSGCKIIGSDYGIRCINTNDILIQYSHFSGNVTGCYGLTKNVLLNHNVFSHNSIGIDLTVNNGSPQIFNNVFYSNGVAISVSSSELKIMNNIFYLEQNDQKAIVTVCENFVSDYNIYYPSQPDFIFVNGQTYSTIDEVSKAEGLEVNSKMQDPEFVDVENDDFSVRETSPAIDAGSNVGLFYDINGIAIPSGEAPDIGVVETSSSVTSLKPSVSFEKLRFYPNPVYDITTFEMSQSFAGNGQIQIMDLTGKVLLSSKVTVTDFYNNRRSIQMDLSTLNSGLYVVKFLIGSEIFSAKLSKY